MRTALRDVWRISASRRPVLKRTRSSKTSQLERAAPVDTNKRTYPGEYPPLVIPQVLQLTAAESLHSSGAPCAFLPRANSGVEVSKLSVPPSANVLTSPVQTCRK